MKIKTIWKEFFNPRFTTEELENSRTRGGVKFEIKSLIFDDEREHFPTRAIGRVALKSGSMLIVVWNQHGECMYEGNRMPQFDLLRPTQKEIDAAKPVFVSMVGIIILLLITIIFN